MNEVSLSPLLGGITLHKWAFLYIMVRNVEAFAKNAEGLGFSI